MMEKNEKKENAWYNNGNKLVDLILATILLIIIFSQSFATTGGFSLTLFGSIINHNSVYLFVLIYFILLKFSFGKRYFNYLNLVLIFLYGLTTITSLITLVQAFTLNTVLEFTINFALLVYLFHTMLRGTVVWKDFKLGNSPFNELSNETSYYIVIVLSVFILIVDLISTAVLRGIIISLLDAVFLILFGRYIFLYRKYLDDKKIDVNNAGNFDEVRKAIDDTVDSAHEKVQEVLDKTDIDEKIQGVLDKTDIDEKIVEVKDMVVEEVKDTKDAAVKFVKEKTKEDKKPIKKKTTSKKVTKKGESK
ncbi:MAG: hypothetical protein IJG97_01085 [Bacilli bacterium]|nr:hypothetical protein [Bacilli bacterium]